MKKIILMFVIFLISFSPAFAVPNNESATNNGNQYGTLTAVSTGAYTSLNGQEMSIEQIQNRNRLRVGEYFAEYSLELQEERSLTGESKLKATLSNGQNAEIKVMPDVAAERALERLKLKVCQEEEGCTIELKEVGQGDQIQPVYEVQARKEARMLGMFKTQMQVRAQVNAETGEVIRVQKPWWAFLASESDEIEEDESATLE
ncbi:hypothetical protein HOD53_01415 [Candidatus Woesearchaeota archaeon]|nr:hypothetical protein [Candidatus Woesearchaeota archaeon]